jgi:hypothetical protein
MFGVSCHMDMAINPNPSVLQKDGLLNVLCFEWTFYVMNADPLTPVSRFLELMHVKGNS